MDQKSFGLNTPLAPLRGQLTGKLLSQKAAHLRLGSPLWAGEIARFKPGTAGLQSGVITNEPLINQLFFRRTVRANKDYP
jgi:hypothetical protein